MWCTQDIKRKTLHILPKTNDNILVNNNHLMENLKIENITRIREIQYTSSHNTSLSITSSSKES